MRGGTIGGRRVLSGDLQMRTCPQLAEPARTRNFLGFRGDPNRAGGGLLDDVLSELDEARRLRVLEAACAAEQALITMVDGERQPSKLKEAVATFWIQAGTVTQEG